MIRRARRDGREARGNEEREKREDEKGEREPLFHQVLRVREVGAQASTFGFFKLIECIIKKEIYHGVKQNAKICAIGEQNVIN